MAPAAYHKIVYQNKWSCSVPVISTLGKLQHVAQINMHSYYVSRLGDFNSFNYFLASINESISVEGPSGCSRVSNQTDALRSNHTLPVHHTWPLCTMKKRRSVSLTARQPF